MRHIEKNDVSKHDDIPESVEEEDPYLGDFLSHSGPVHGLHIHSGQLYTCSGDNTARAYSLLVWCWKFKSSLHKTEKPYCLRHEWRVKKCVFIHSDQRVWSGVSGSHKQSELSAGVVSTEHAGTPLHRIQWPNYSLLQHKGTKCLWKHLKQGKFFLLSSPISCFSFLSFFAFFL